MMEEIIGNANYEQPNIEEKKTMANYYAPMFDRKQRTPEFLEAFAECFGDDSHICDLPRPLLCNECITKYIEKCNKLVVESDNDIYKDVIFPRLAELGEHFKMLFEHLKVSREDINPDVVLEFLGINMDPYDPASTDKLEQCTTTTFVKKENKEENDTCPICICEFEEQETIKTLICKHVFHEQCVMTWLSDHSTCPICKASLK
jgi:hypothetical protein